MNVSTIIDPAMSNWDMSLFYSHHEPLFRAQMEEAYYPPAPANPYFAVNAYPPQEQYHFYKRPMPETQYCHVQTLKSDLVDFLPEELAVLLGQDLGDAPMASSDTSSIVASPPPAMPISPSLATESVSTPIREVANAKPTRRASRKHSESTLSEQGPKRKRSTSSTPTPPPQVVPVVKSKRARALEMMIKRDIHNDSERHRRGEMKDGLVALRTALPARPERMNTGQLLQHAIAHIRELQNEDARLEAEKAALQQACRTLRPDTVF